ncbi:RecQ family ATP-dependent DNA helicase [Paraliomyxa miuraensis]|uniref:RecQ family ATP-dependent DNA helicase n=1 Tax=Paraliomyxa miuraensis TaxID=376150 RepID=UPI0022592416|nr:ATP-dependent DNA helicase RecQ [Paraliomyxa miuraensis]MCX4240672.1 ATP-dependent DNA helicase [Paraliomyxa miuraensis]
MPPSLPVDLDAGLRRLGYEQFRPGQRDAVRAVLDVGRLLLVAPTGGGKSLTYQLPATLLPGVALVVSPLIALMADQVQSLGERGVRATYLAATLGGDELRKRMAQVAEGAHDLVYVSPERLAFPGFRGLISQLPLSLVAVDEAHCISEWGHDFRPEYLQIGELLRELRPPRVMACTATATPVVRDEILDRLGLPADTPQLVRGFARPNLALRVIEIGRPRERALHVDQALAEVLGKPSAARSASDGAATRGGTAIVYAPTRKTCEAEAERLGSQGWRAAAYHAGLTGPQRDKAQRAFMSDRLDVVVATNAFGMGIDRADVRAVIHLAPPGSIEAYYQEVGRAGRDGQPAVGVMMLATQDIALRRRLLERDVDGVFPDPAVVEHKWGLFLELMRWAEGGSCRHDTILRYFGDDDAELTGCGHCDVCRSLGDDEAPDPEEVSMLVRKALSGVARVHRRFGLHAAVKLLRGVDDPRLARSGLSSTRTFGILSDRSEDWVTRLVRRCVTAGWVDFHGQEHPVLLLTSQGHAVMTGQQAAKILLPDDERARSGGRSGSSRAANTGRPSEGKAANAGANAVVIELDDEGETIFAALRAYRMERARADGVPPYVVASDRTLREIAILRPHSLDELAQAHGIGPTKLERYGEALLDVVAKAG